MIRGVELGGMMAKQQARDHRLVAVDLFCGVGGLTHGLVRAGIPVSVGIDLDPACKYPFEANNKSEFILSDVADITPARNIVNNYGPAAYWAQG